MNNTDNFTPTEKHIIDALRYMRVPPQGRTDELTRTVIEAFGRLELCAQPRCVWGRYRVQDMDFHSRDIARLTARSDECILLAATLGHDVDRQINLAQTRNMLDGLALDACASVRIDAYIDDFTLTHILPGLHEGERLTRRFSPGYGDLGMNVTEDIITILNATKRIGLTVTRSLMMSPIKSVTAIAGLFKKSAS